MWMMSLPPLCDSAALHETFSLHIDALLTTILPHLKSFKIPNSSYFANRKSVILNSLQPLIENKKKAKNSKNTKHLSH